MNQSRRRSGGHQGQVGRRLASGGLDGGQQRGSCHGRQHHAPRGQVVGARDAIDMGPEAEQQHQRHADVDEHQHREEAVVDRVGGEEIACRGPLKKRQPVEQFGGGDRGELRQPVPDDPVAADAGDVHQPDQRYAGDPGVEAEAVVAAVGPFAQQVQEHHQDEGVGGIAMQAAHHAAQIPLFPGQPADRVVDAFNAGIEHGVEIETAGDQDPEEIQPSAPRWRSGLSVPPKKASKVLGAFEGGVRAAASMRAHVGDPECRLGCRLLGINDIQSADFSLDSQSTGLNPVRTALSA
jgi:hypothetical protein